MELRGKATSVPNCGLPLGSKKKYYRKNNDEKTDSIIFWPPLAPAVTSTATEKKVRHGGKKYRLEKKNFEFQVVSIQWHSLATNYLPVLPSSSFREYTSGVFSQLFYYSKPRGRVRKSRDKVEKMVWGSLIMAWKTIAFLNHSERYAVLGGKLFVCNRINI